MLLVVGDAVRTAWRPGDTSVETLHHSFLDTVDHDNSCSQGQEARPNQKPTRAAVDEDRRHYRPRAPHKKALGLRALRRGQSDPYYCPRCPLRSIDEGPFAAHETSNLPERLGDFVRGRHHAGTGDRGTEVGTRPLLRLAPALHSAHTTMADDKQPLNLELTRVNSRE